MQMDSAIITQAILAAGDRTTGQIFTAHTCFSVCVPRPQLINQSFYLCCGGVRRWLLAAGFSAVRWSGCYFRSLKIGLGGMPLGGEGVRNNSLVLQSPGKGIGMFRFFSCSKHQSATGLRDKGGEPVLAQQELGPAGEDRCLGDKPLKTVLQHCGK